LPDDPQLFLARKALIRACRRFLNYNQTRLQARLPLFNPGLPGVLIPNPRSNTAYIGGARVPVWPTGVPEEYKPVYTSHLAWRDQLRIVLKKPRRGAAPAPQAPPPAVPVPDPAPQAAAASGWNPATIGQALSFLDRSVQAQERNTQAFESFTTVATSLLQVANRAFPPLDDADLDP